MITDSASRCQNQRRDQCDRHLFLQPMNMSSPPLPRPLSKRLPSLPLLPIPNKDHLQISGSAPTSPLLFSTGKDQMYNPEFNDSYPPLDYSPSPSPFPSTPPPSVLTIPDKLGPCFEFDSVSEAMKALNYPDTPYNSSNSCCSSGGSCISSPSSFPSSGSHATACSFMQRSCSTLSLQKNYGYCLPFGSTPEFADAEDSSVRRVCSDGDLQRINGGSQQGQRSGGSQLMSESNMIIEGLSRTLPYSPEEKKERIERYRSKRTQRNFNKKIKYACRKTLADSRPRIRGRFARNDEIEKTDPQLLWNHQMGQGEYDDEAEPEDGDNWVEFLDAFSSGNLLP